MHDTRACLSMSVSIYVCFMIMHEKCVKLERAALEQIKSTGASGGKATVAQLCHALKK